MRGRQRAGEGCELPKRNLYGLLMAEMEPLWGIAGNLYGARDLASHCFYRGGAEPLWAIPQDGRGGVGALTSDHTVIEKSVIFQARRRGRVLGPALRDVDAAPGPPTTR